MVKQWRRFVVLHHGRLCVRSRARARHRGGGRSQQAARWSARPPSACDQDFSSFLLQAQASKAKMVALANAGGDTINAIKQAAEFGIVQGGQKLAGMLVIISDVACARPADRAGTDADRGLLLGPSEANPRFVEGFAAPKWRQDADHGPCRRLCRGAALPQGGRSVEGQDDGTRWSPR